MQQWKYSSLSWTEAGLFRLHYHDHGIVPEPVPIDPIVDQNNPSITIRRWLSALGEQGWELVSVIRDEQAQEWVLKQPIEYEIFS